jgi:hypothetical protein
MSGVDDHWRVLHLFVQFSARSIVDGGIGLHLRLSLPVEEGFEEAFGKIRRRALFRVRISGWGVSAKLSSSQ